MPELILECVLIEARLDRWKARNATTTPSIATLLVIANGCKRERPNDPNRCSNFVQARSDPDGEKLFGVVHFTKRCQSCASSDITLCSMHDEFKFVVQFAVKDSSCPPDVDLASYCTQLSLE